MMRWLKVKLLGENVWLDVEATRTRPLLCVKVPPVPLKAPSTSSRPLVDVKVPPDRLKSPPMVMALLPPVNVPALWVWLPLRVRVTPDDWVTVSDLFISIDP